MERSVEQIPEVQSFIRELRSEVDARDPRLGPRVENDIIAHIRDALREDEQTDAGVVRVLNELGSPHEIALAVEQTTTQPTWLLKIQSFLSTRVALAAIVIVMALGAYLPYVWIPAIIGVWLANQWSRSTKIIATMICPLTMLVSSFSFPVFAVAFPASFIVTALWLLVRGVRRPRP